MTREQQALLEAMLEGQARIEGKIDKWTTDLAEFSERFEEVITTLENERRLDLAREYD